MNLFKNVPQYINFIKVYICWFIIFFLFLIIMLPYFLICLQHRSSFIWYSIAKSIHWPYYKIELMYIFTLFTTMFVMNRYNMNSLTKQLHIWTSMLVAGGLLKLSEYSLAYQIIFKTSTLNEDDRGDWTCNRCLMYLRVRFMHKFH